MTFESAMDVISKYWLTAICALLAGLIGKLWSKVKKNAQAQKAVHGGLLALLRDRIYQSCQYHLEHKHITSGDRQVLNEMFEQYFLMGGNGVVKHLKSQIDALPTVVQRSH